MSRPRPQRPRYTGPGMTAGNMRNGVRNLDLYCRLCHHTALLNVDHPPEDFELMKINRQLVCTCCGPIGETDCRPNWAERKVLPNLTGDQYPKRRVLSD
jgi:hypothetical protein